MMMMIHVDNVDDAQHNILFCIKYYITLPTTLLLLLLCYDYG